MMREIVFWHWWAFGALLLILELLAPGMFFLWMAEAAGVTGLLLWMFPTLPLEYQVIAFSVMSIASIGVFRKYLKKHPIVSDQPLLNRRTAIYIGRVFTLEQPIINGQGRIHVDDTSWKIHGDDCPAGTKVRVVDADGVVLKVLVVE
ncbi:NfeD family protein [Methylococcus sp. EFPC2]|uniref:NfeD family protein n=1 Tax=Methylococcus sp. EFPC2 TaxID=2812648 RepID=UPI00196882E0|nr:NfeD family protein [Methylococcus sp. EFPC2]QSA96481.1 NfeD family protein [Methylococcus sp. EFPC2]